MFKDRLYYAFFVKGVIFWEKDYYSYSSVGIFPLQLAEDPQSNWAKKIKLVDLFSTKGAEQARGSDLYKTKILKSVNFTKIHA